MDGAELRKIPENDLSCADEDPESLWSSFEQSWKFVQGSTVESTFNGVEYTPFRVLSGVA